MLATSRARHTRRSSLFVAVFIAVLLIAAAALRARPYATAGQATPAATWLLVSDLHFDPFASPAVVGQLDASPVAKWRSILESVQQPPSTYFNDSNYALLRSALTSMRTNAADPQVVLIGGDFLAHKFQQKYQSATGKQDQASYTAFVNKTMAFLASEFDEAFPRAQFAFTLGNNDSDCGDYTSGTSAFFAGMAAAWAPLVNRGGRAPDFAQTFAAGGYYRARLPVADGEIAVVNTTGWSPNYTSPCGGAGAGGQQLAWVTANVPQLARNAWLLGHIPPGIDVYASTSQPSPVLLLGPSYQDALLTVLRRRPWAAMMTGHLHMNDFRLADSLPILIVPSVTPLFGNNPSYFTASVSTTTGVVIDYSAFVLPLGGTAPPAWTLEYTYSGTYGLPDVSRASLAALQAKLGADATLLGRFMQFYDSGSAQGAIAPADYRRYWCGNGFLTTDAYASCVRKGS